MAEVRWLDPQQRAAWLRLTAVLGLLPAALDAQLTRDEGLTQFEYYCLAMLSEAPERTLRMTALAARTNATLPRLSRVISGLERAGFVVREPCPADRRATNAVLTPAGWDKIVHAAPGHVATVRELVIDALTPTQLAQLARICERLLVRLDPDDRMLAALE
jgi:DNA-binding MarR family transcriptional regulator